METKYVDCHCGCVEHILRFEYDADNPEDMMMVYIYLDDYLGFWKRLWYGIKYIFGCRNKSVAYADVLVDTKRAAEIRDFCEQYIEAIK